ncbi:MAG: DMT family transporter [Acidimicrobiia bacterium]
MLTRLITVDVTVGRLGIAVTCAVAAALSYALSNVLQQHEAEQVAEEKTLKIGLLAQLARRPRWLFGMGADVGGYVFEAIALGTGTLVLVEPILATSLLLSLFLGASINRRHIDRAGWAAAVVLAFGVSLFLLVVAPTRGAELATTRSWLIAAPPIIGFVTICVLAARAASGSNRAAFLGLGAGALFGTSAVLTKAFVHYLGGGAFNWVSHWEPYALAVTSITGLVLAQSAFQTGGLAAAVGAEQVMQPLTGVALGVGLLNEKLGLSGSLAAIVLIGALVAMLWGVLTLARVEHSDMLVRPQPPALADG